MRHKKSRDVQWFLYEDDKKPYAKSTNAISDSFDALVEKGDTPNIVHAKIFYDNELKNIIKYQIDAGFGDVPYEFDEFNRIKPRKKNLKK